MSADTTKQADQGTALVPVASAPPPNALILPEEWGVGERHGALMTSIDESTQEGRDKIMAAMLIPGENAAGWINKEFALEDVTIHPISFPGENGEIVNTVRVLFHVEGDAIIDFRSDGILKSLGLVYRFKGKPPYRPGHRFILERIPTGDGTRSMYVLRPAADKPTSQKSKKP